MIHTEPHPLAGKTVKLLISATDNFTIEDWQDRVYNGKSWQVLTRNPACIYYASRVSQTKLPIDDEVVYGKINGIGYIIHISELGDVVE